MHPSCAEQQWRSRENSPASHQDSRSTHRVCLLPSPNPQSTFVNLSNLTPAGHQVLVLCRPRMADSTKECVSYSTRAFACPYSTSHPPKGTWGGRGSTRAEKREDSGFWLLRSTMI